MPVRSTMGALITRVRELISDLDPDNPVFADQRIQDSLDRFRTVVRYAPLDPYPTYAPGGGAIRWLDYYSADGDWEASPQLVHGDWSVLTPATSDELTGHWTFAADTIPPVYLTGATYDVYRAGAALLRQQATQYKLTFDYQDGDQRVWRGQQRTALLELAADLEAHARPQRIQMVRPDVNPYA